MTSTHKQLFVFASQLRHDPICRKVFNKKCKFSLKQRLQGRGITTVKRQPLQKKQPGKKSNWSQKALKEGCPLPPPPPSSINPDYVQCPHCSRRFNEAAAQRHMKFCEEQAACCVFAVKSTRQALVSAHSHTYVEVGKLLRQDTLQKSWTTISSDSSATGFQGNSCREAETWQLLQYIEKALPVH
uniref:Zinc finger C2HC-type containing 1B n=1 Tax=Strix occidentalis caurina TaxID=311401 RepID=A0A8D0F4G2_STROC